MSHENSIKEIQEIKIIARPSPVPSVCSFAIDQLQLNRIIHCKNEEEAQDFFVKELFKIEGVREVLVNNKMITISKGDSSRDWKDLGKEIGAKVRDLMNGEKKLFEEVIAEKKTIKYPRDFSENEKNLWDKISQYLHDEINPALSSHQGSIELQDVKGNRAYVLMQGGCHGCSRSTETLKNGVETYLKEKIPELESLEDMTNHGEGENPFFK